MDKNYTGWEISTGLVPGFMLGIRTYETEDNSNIDYVLYIGIFDICLTFYYD